MVSFIAYFGLITLSPWYYSMSFTQNHLETLNRDKQEEEGFTERELVEPFHTDRYGYHYNSKGERINEYGDIQDGAGQWMPDPSAIGELETDEEFIERQVAGELPREEPKQLTLKEKMILERENAREPLEGEEDLQRNYKNQGKFSWIDYLFILGVSTALSYGYGLFLSNGKTLFKLLTIPTVILIGKTLYAIKATKIYRLNVVNVLNWWLGFVILIVFMVINHMNIIFVCKEVGEIEDII